jgi:hypothetical protein
MTLGDYRIENINSKASSYSHNIKIQNLSDGRWAIFVRTSYVEETFMPIGPIYPNRLVASKCLDLALLDNVLWV